MTWNWWNCHDELRDNDQKENGYESVTYEWIPIRPRWRGCDWIKPDDITADFTGETLLEFTVNDDAIVYVGHDEKIVKKPAWLADWKDTGEAVLGGYLGTEHSFRLFEKAFPKNAKVKLGPNGERPKDPRTGRPEGWIYITIVKRSSAR